MVCADWRIKHSASPVAVCGFGRAKAKSRTELEYRRLGRYGAQDCAVDSDNEEQNLDSDAVESCWLSDLHGQQTRLVVVHC
jgi:hypothetical protein